MPIDLNDFVQEKDCVLKDERYSVRDNGAVLRHAREGMRLRKDDNQWTFGKPNDKTGYMEIATVRIHRIMATAFHGEPPTPEHVVDHIDTNRRNNRPENLRWLTRLENALKNPITRRRIELACGSIENFLANPSILQKSDVDPNFEWMRTVSLEEAKACRKNLEEWAKSDKKPSGNGGALGEWVYRKRHSAPVFQAGYIEEEQEEISDLVIAKTTNAAQRYWRTPSEFPCCPTEPDKDPIATYATNIKVDSVFSRNDYGESIVLDSAIHEQSLIVMTESKSESSVKPWAVAKITYEDGLYVHESLGSFFDDNGAKKEFTIAQGLEWTGGQTFDDLCG
jgi:hypothetical protein